MDQNLTVGGWNLMKIHETPHYSGAEWLLVHSLVNLISQNKSVDSACHLYIIYIDIQNDTKGINSNMGTQLPVNNFKHFNHFFVF